MRSFLAIELSEAVKSALSGLQRNFRSCGADIRWVNPDNIHLTLKFLGEITEETVRDIVKLMTLICSRNNSFQLDIKGINVFPGLKSPRVLWVGVEDLDSLNTLQQEIEEGTTSLGFKRENRKFKPHLTLGRFRSSKEKESIIKACSLRKEDVLGSVDVKSVSLMKSELNSSGARHSIIAELPLAGKHAG